MNTTANARLVAPDPLVAETLASAVTRTGAGPKPGSAWLSARYLAFFNLTEPC
jgi:hypothetical protein